MRIHLLYSKFKEEDRPMLRRNFKDHPLNKIKGFKTYRRCSSSYKAKKRTHSLVSVMILEV